MLVGPERPATALAVLLVNIKPIADLNHARFVLLGRFHFT